jgi:hypothetical protein
MRLTRPGADPTTVGSAPCHRRNCSTDSIRIRYGGGPASRA